MGDHARDRRSTTRSGPCSASALFIGQAFLYNSILFGYATLLSTFFHVATADAPYYLVAFAAGNLLGPILLAPLFDTVGRKPMIAGTYILSGVLLLITGYLFDQHQLNATTLTIAWSVVFFFASAGVSAAYLTVCEIFPLETRALAIAVFYAVGTGLGGIIGPQLFGTSGADGQHVGRVRGACDRRDADDRRRRDRDRVRRQGRAAGGLEGIAKPLTAVSSSVRSGVGRASAGVGAGAGAVTRRPSTAQP